MSRGVGIEALLFLLAAACAVGGFGLPRLGFDYEPPEKGEALRVVTWNVGVARDFESGDDGVAPSGTRDLARRRILETLVALQPDLCVLQETSERQAEEIAAAFDKARLVFSAPGRVAIVAIDGRIQSLDSGSLVNLVYRRRGAPRVRVVGIHADAWSAEERNREIGEAIEELEEGRADVRILAGDLNLDVDVEGGQDLFTEDEYLDVQPYSYVAERLVDAAAGTGPTAEPDRRLDYIFVRGAEVRDAGVWRGRRVGAMDHHPVVVDLLFND